ncbi:hypothetical protein HYPSUDRAFT_203350 [Hypholoma sublateritium FD-334 SS-4]|uniref:Helicase C-terminal domain-containing protein n=1 Tax=Hypholoma sublateritium (strain FD-334 SS-4) TaxID=945553 RepID=A0A0D2PM43_HYPSF|nr:hypothetical protein HYPSUDRAFT_203350 [Hypholoma sublateritium FD-334 SS-4]
MPDLEVLCPWPQLQSVGLVTCAGSSLLTTPPLSNAFCDIKASLCDKAVRTAAPERATLSRVLLHSSPSSSPWQHPAAAPAATLRQSFADIFVRGYLAVPIPPPWAAAEVFSRISSCPRSAAVGRARGVPEIGTSDTIDICTDIGPWAADWFVSRVLDRVRAAANPYNNMMVTWKKSEKGYLLSVLDQIVASPVSYYGPDIIDDLSDKTRALIASAVLALAEVLAHHPATRDVFSTGTLLGTSESTHRHSMMDITRGLVREVSQEVVLADFKSGERNLIISTAVAEEGIDIQACGSVICWNLPQNMASWAQSKGRARRRRSTFTIA